VPHFQKPTFSIHSIIKIPSTTNLKEVLADLRSQKLLDFSAAAKKYDCWPSTLRRRYFGETTSREEATDTYHSALPKAQERALVDLINKLTGLGLPPTPRIVKNLAEEIRGERVGKNWVGQFVKHHEDELKSLYLRCIDNKQFKSKYGPAYELFFDLVLSTDFFFS
jgi:hypothetical protein